MRREPTLRLSQTLSPFGVGAIYAVLGQSFVACDIGYWKQHGRTLRAPRLERALGVAELREAPAKAMSAFDAAPVPGVPFARFPRWLFCANNRCRRMTHWRKSAEEPGEVPTCQHCGSKRALVPMRFVVACPEGHLDDVPWGFWAHSNTDSREVRQCQAQQLVFRSSSKAGGGLASLSVECLSCGGRRTLHDLPRKGSLAALNVRCRGVQPWHWAEDSSKHDTQIEVIQRGASNVHFARVRSSIDIPPESNYDEFSSIALAVTTTPEFKIIASAPSGPLTPMLVETLATKFNTTADEIWSIVRGEDARVAGPATEDDDDDIQGAEWSAFLTPQPERDDRDRFVTEHVAMPADRTSGLLAMLEPLGSVVKATRLREVRALTGFTRLRAGNTVVRPDLGRGVNFLPAIEVYGEGVFVTLDPARVSAWEAGPARARAEVLQDRLEAAEIEWLPEATPRFVLLHSFAHLLIRQLAFESGYPSASLRERVYARSGERDETGVLIYTAAGDQEGTLGGLVRQGEPDRLAASLLALLERATWCGADPICRESRGQGLHGLSLAACHACTLVSETSCVHANALLDRTLVAGSPTPGVSFFAESLGRALADVSERANP